MDNLDFIKTIQLQFEFSAIAQKIGCVSALKTTYVRSAKNSYPFCYIIYTFKKLEELQFFWIRMIGK